MTCSQCGFMESNELRSVDFYLGVRETVSYLMGSTGVYSKKELESLLRELYENADGLCHDWYRAHMMIMHSPHMERKTIAQSDGECCEEDQGN